MIKGIDGSKHNGKANWDGMKGDCIEFTITGGWDGSATFRGRLDEGACSLRLKNREEGT